MAKTVKVVTPLTDEAVSNLKAGDTVSITGYIYTGRDAAHKRLISLLKKGEKLPIEIKNQIIYYVGPAPVNLVMLVVLPVQLQVIAWTLMLQHYWIKGLRV